MADPTPINSTTYVAMNTSILDIINGGNYAAISIFTDASGVEYHPDEYGNINNRIILSITLTDSYLDNSGNATDAFVTITFQNLDGTPGGQYVISLTTTDNVDTHWYRLTNVPVPPFIFNLRRKPK